VDHLHEPNSRDADADHFRKSLFECSLEIPSFPVIFMESRMLGDFHEFFGPLRSRDRLCGSRRSP
jgi:hypothetical protein